MFFRLRQLPEERDIRQRAETLLESIGLEQRRDFIATNIPFGEQRRLEIARALATEPDLLLLNEPTSGMNPRETEDIDELIKKIQGLGKTVLLIMDFKREGRTILLVEQNAKKAWQCTDRGYVLETGNIVLTGSGAALLTSAEVQAAYLGGSA